MTATSMSATRTPLPPDSPGTPDRWLVLAVVSMDYFLLYVHRSLLGYLKQPLSSDLDLSGEEFGWLGPAWNVPYAVAQLGVGYLGDRYPRRAVLLGSLVASAVALGAMGLASSFAELVVWRIVLGLAQAPSVPAIASAMADSFTSRTRSTAVGIYLVSYNLGLVLAATLSGRVADTPVWTLALGGQTLTVAGWRLALLLFGGLGGLGALLFLLLFHEPPRAERDAGGGQSLPFLAALLAVLRVRTFLALLGAFVLTTTAVLAIQLWLPGYLAQRFALRLEEAAFQGTAWIQGGTVAGLLVGGRLADRLARRHQGGRTLVQVVGLALTVPAVVLVGTLDTLPLLAVPMAVYGIGLGFYQANLWTTTFEVVDPAARSTAVGLLNVASGVFGFWCSPLIGSYAGAGGDLGHALAGLGVLLAAALAILGLSSRSLLPHDYRAPPRAE